MIITDDGYSINYLPNKNLIKIVLPQTARTITNTTQPISDRQVDVSGEALATILAVVKIYFKVGDT